MDGWMDGWMETKAGLRIAYSNQQNQMHENVHRLNCMVLVIRLSLVCLLLECNVVGFPLLFVCLCILVLLRQFRLKQR